ncbi:hypothetical protein [Sulfurisphaera tokodaii]|uniref:Uncharacterized protein n=2 Tax=Sulfurisphaera tokodaii TaxID=111955 RepID=Q96Z83_SULTO|nr:hypothetical protein [Sulfurisphaera tokodaii]BAB67043.1 hypothetical protein STK_19480 [Sulfurisphaera tokodaii str. 7]HII74482.1 hypothetical protein [Sulfurisphaera tokodaii]
MIQKIYYIIPGIIAIIIIALVVYGFILYFSSASIYSNTEKLIFSYIFSPLNKTLKNLNSAETFTANYTVFNIIYYNASEEELDNTIYNVSMLVGDLEYILLDLLAIIGLYAIYIFLFFRSFNNNIKREIIRGIYGIIIPCILYIPILFITITNAILFLVSIIGPLLLTLLNGLAHFLPLDYASSIVDALIFGLDISLVVIWILIERISDNELARIKDPSDKIELKFFKMSKILEFINNLLVTIVKVSIVILLAFSVSISILAYYNIAFLVEDILFIAKIMEFLICIASLSLILDIIIYINSKAIGS